MLLDELSFISQSQLLSTEANHPFEVGRGEREVFRPPGYGRAALFETVFGPLDVKGIGIAPALTPALNSYGTGLLDLPEAVLETCLQKFLANVVSDFGPATVETRAILVPPIRMRNRLTGGGALQCAFLVRDAYPRIHPSNDKALLDEISCFVLLIENRIRRLGVTSAAPLSSVAVRAAGGDLEVLTCNGTARFDTASAQALLEHIQYEGIPLPATFDQTNVQFAIDPETRRMLLIDFGAYRFQRRFHHHLMVAYRTGADIYVRLQRAGTNGFVRAPDKVLAAARSFRVVNRRLPNDLATGDCRVRSKELAVRALELLCVMEAPEPLCTSIDRLVRGELDLIASGEVTRRSGAVGRDSLS